ncbi:MAG: hypothetical protein M3Y87_03885, partial [Myxococcota bacterium]|nr:hypothetical protein [Myxococcota bacterium]
MSTSAHAWSRAIVVAIVCVLAASALGSARASAQETEEADEGPITGWARAIAEGSMPRWTGPRVPWAASVERPDDGAYVARSMLR